MSNEVRAVVYNLRRKMGLTQGQLAERLDVTLASVWRWENGWSIAPRSLKLLAALAEEREDKVSAALFRLAIPLPHRPRRRAAGI